MVRFRFSPLFLLFSFLVNAQVQSPDSFLGYTLGTHFTRHHEVVDYYQHLEDNSAGIKLHPYGKYYFSGNTSNRTITSNCRKNCIEI